MTIIAHSCLECCYSNRRLLNRTLNGHEIRYYNYVMCVEILKLVNSYKLYNCNSLEVTYKLFQQCRELLQHNAYHAKHTLMHFDFVLFAREKVQILLWPRQPTVMHGIIQHIRKNRNAIAYMHASAKYSMVL